MNEPKPKTTLTLAPIEKVVPSMIGLTIGFGFGHQIYEVIGNATGWGLYSPATFIAGTSIAGAIGALAGYLTMAAINVFGIKKNS